MDHEVAALSILGLYREPLLGNKDRLAYQRGLRHFRGLGALGHGGIKIQGALAQVSEPC